VHLESDTRVVRDSIDPLNPCPNEKWGEFKFLDPATKQCTSFGYIGAATGISQYKGRFFINRVIDGAIVDAGSAPSSSSKFNVITGTTMVSTPSNVVTEVEENGSVNSITRIPPYRKDLLIGVRDLDIVNNQIFYVQGQGPGAHIGVLRLVNGSLQKHLVCNLGEMNWAQAPKGLAVASWSDELFPSLAPAPDSIGTSTGTSPTNYEQTRKRIAYFTIKTSSGDIINAFAMVNPSKGHATTCVVHRNNLASIDVENKRTNGITRAGESIPYWIY
jgi:hypothetical protein